MYSFLRDKIVAFWSTMHGSETIIWARLQVALGSLYAGAQLFDVSQFDIDKKWVMAWIVGNGALSEYLRRRKAEYHDDGEIK